MLSASLWETRAASHVSPNSRRDQSPFQFSPSIFLILDPRGCFDANFVWVSDSKQKIKMKLLPQCCTFPAVSWRSKTQLDRPGWVITVVSGSYSVIYHRVYAGLQLKNCQKEILMQTQMLCLSRFMSTGIFRDGYLLTSIKVASKYIRLKSGLCCAEQHANISRTRQLLFGWVFCLGDSN